MSFDATKIFITTYQEDYVDIDEMPLTEFMDRISQNIPEEHKANVSISIESEPESSYVNIKAGYIRDKTWEEQEKEKRDHELAILRSRERDLALLKQLQEKYKDSKNG